MWIYAAPSGKPLVMLEVLGTDERWPWALLLRGPFLGAPVRSSWAVPVPTPGWDVMCGGCFTGACGLRALCSNQLVLRVRRGLSVINAFVCGVEDAARVPRAPGLGAEQEPALRCPRSCWNPGPTNPGPASLAAPPRPPERAVAVGICAGLACARQGLALLLSPSSACFPKAFPCRYFSCWLQG